MEKLPTGNSQRNFAMECACESISVGRCFFFERFIGVSFLCERLDVALRAYSDPLGDSVDVYRASELDAIPCKLALFPSWERGPIAAETSQGKLSRRVSIATAE